MVIAMKVVYIMLSASQIADELVKWPINKRERFYTLLAHQLTVDVRVLWLDIERSVESRVESILSLNELQHRVLGKLLALQRGDLSWTDAEFIQSVHRFVIDSGIRGEAGRAFGMAWRITQSTKM